MKWEVMEIELSGGRRFALSIVDEEISEIFAPVEMHAITGVAANSERALDWLFPDRAPDGSDRILGCFFIRSELQNYVEATRHSRDFPGALWDAAFRIRQLLESEALGFIVLRRHESTAQLQAYLLHEFCHLLYANEPQVSATAAQNCGIGGRGRPGLGSIQSGSTGLRRRALPRRVCGPHGRRICLPHQRRCGRCANLPGVLQIRKGSVSSCESQASRRSTAGFAELVTCGRGSECLCQGSCHCRGQRRSFASKIRGRNIRGDGVSDFVVRRTLSRSGL